jgi:thiamine biosynthesis lipoprotein
MMQQPFRYSFPAMTTECSLQFYGCDQKTAQTVSTKIVQRISQLTARYNFYNDQSWLNRVINQRKTLSVAIDEEFFQILSIVHDHSHLTQGAFDITVGTYSRLVRQAKSLAEIEQIKTSLQGFTGLNLWSVSEGRVHFEYVETQFDLGGVIKEFAVDEAARIARDAGILSGLINFGGDLYAIGRKPNQQRFVAAIPHPRQPHQLLFGMDLEHQALTTSGHYARQRPVSDGAVSHVMQTTAPLSKVVSASVVSASALVSGIYSTALLVSQNLCLPPEAHAVVVDDQGKLHPLPAGVLAATLFND